ncbi:6348_t:CDS:2, partial [Acaulospora morrowiae]
YGWDIASALPDTQDDWMKGKDLLIEKAKTLVEIKKVKQQKIYESAKTNNVAYGENKYYDSNKFFHSNYRNKNKISNSSKCYICEEYGHYANEYPSDSNKDNYKQRAYYSTAYNILENENTGIKISNRLVGAWHIFIFQGINNANELSKSTSLSINRGTKYLVRNGNRKAKQNTGNYISIQFPQASKNIAGNQSNILNSKKKMQKMEISNRLEMTKCYTTRKDIQIRGI